MSNPTIVRGLDPWTLLSGLERHTRLYTFGRSDSQLLGQALDLGGHTGIPSQFPRPVLEGLQFIQASSGPNHSAAVTLGGQLYVWGSDSHGQLGVGLKSLDRPTANPSSTNLAPPTDDDHPSPGFSLATPSLNTSATSSSAQAAAGGAGSPFQEYPDLVSRPALLVCFPVRLCIDRAVSKVACGVDFTLAALTGPQGGILAWGRNHMGQLGIPPEGPGEGIAAPQGLGWAELHVPHFVPALDGIEVADISAGQDHAALVTRSGVVYTWGLGRNGRLGRGPAAVGPRGFPPGRVEGLIARLKATQVACGYSHTLCLTDGGAVFAWGGGFKGATGQGDFTDRLVPVSVSVPPCSHVAASNVSMAVSKQYGQIYVWGENRMIGVKSRGPGAAKPQFMSQFADELVVSVACGLEHAVAVTDKGSVLAWGDPNLLPTLDQLREHRQALRSGSFPGLQMRETIQAAACGAHGTLLLCAPTRFELDRKTLEAAMKNILEWYMEHLQGQDRAGADRAGQAIVSAQSQAMKAKSARKKKAKAAEAAQAGPLENNQSAPMQPTVPGGLMTIAEDDDEEEGEEDEDDEGGDPSSAHQTHDEDAAAEAEGEGEGEASMAEGEEEEQDGEEEEGEGGEEEEGDMEEEEEEDLLDLALRPRFLEEALGWRKPSSMMLNKMYLRHFVLMCRESGIVDNITGYQELISFFTSVAQVKDYNAYEVAGNLAIKYDDLVELMLKVAKVRFPEAHGETDSLRLLLEGHLGSLQHRHPAGINSLLRGFYNPQVLKAMDEFSTVETLHQCFAFMTYRRGEIEGLAIGVRDAVAALKKNAGGSLIDLNLMCRFLRQSGVMTNGMMSNVREIVSKIGLPLQLPSTMITAGIRLVEELDAAQRALLEDPSADTNVDPFDPEAAWTLYAVVIMLYDPYPGFNCPVDPQGLPQGLTFAQFTEVVTTCALLQGQGAEDDSPPRESSGVIEGESSGGSLGDKSDAALSSRDDDDSRSFSGSVQSSYSRYSAATSASAGTVTDIIRSLVAKMQRWRDSQKDAARGAGGVRSDKDLDDEIDRVFHLYVKLNEQVDEVYIDKLGFMQFCKESKIMDGRFSQTHIDRVLEKTAVPPSWTTEYREKLAEKAAATKKGMKDPSRFTPPAPKPNEKRVLYRNDFTAALERIASSKITRIRGSKAQLRQLVKQFLLPLSKSKSRFMDVFMGQMLHPDVTEVIDEYHPALMELYQIYSNLDEQFGWEANNWEEGEDEDEGDTISFLELSQFAKDKRIVPEILTKAELESIFRKVNYSPGSDDSFLEMSEDEFVDALGLIAIMGFAKDRILKSRPPVERLKALFDYLDIKPGQVEQKRPEDDPFYEWKQVQFDPELEALGNLDIPGVLLPEVVPVPGVDWTEDTADFLSRAHNAFRVGDAPTALEHYQQARARWESQIQPFRKQVADLASQVRALEEKEELEAQARKTVVRMKERDDSEDSLPRQKELLATAEAKLCEVKMFFLLSMGQVLQSDGQDRAALELLKTAEEEMKALPETHPMRDTVNGLAGCAHYHVGEFRLAYRRYVHAKVHRSENPSMGPDHHDTAVANNNLACCLERLGQVEKALELLGKAHESLSRELGPSHRLTAIAARNMAKCRRKEVVITRHVYEAVRRLEEEMDDLSSLGAGRSSSMGADVSDLEDAVLSRRTSAQGAEDKPGAAGPPSAAPPPAHPNPGAPPLMSQSQGDGGYSAPDPALLERINQMADMGSLQSLDDPGAPSKKEAAREAMDRLGAPPHPPPAKHHFGKPSAPKVRQAFLDVLNRPSAHTAYEAAVDLLKAGGKGAIGPPSRSSRRRILPSWRPRAYKAPVWSIDPTSVYGRVREDVLRYARGEAARGPSMAAVLQQLGLEALYIDTQEREKQILLEDMERRGIKKRKKKKKPHPNGTGPPPPGGQPVHVLAVSQGLLNAALKTRAASQTGMAPHTQPLPSPIAEGREARLSSTAGAPLPETPEDPDSPPQGENRRQSRMSSSTGIEHPRAWRPSNSSRNLLSK